MLEAQQLGSSTSQLLYARIDEPRFAQVYSMRGRWSLLDGLNLVPKTGAIEVSAPEMAAAGTLATRAEHHDLDIAPLPSDVADLQQVASTIRDAASDILGTVLHGERAILLPVCAMVDDVCRSMCAKRMKQVQQPGCP